MVNLTDLLLKMSTHCWDCSSLSFTPNEWNEFHHCQDEDITLKLKFLGEDEIVIVFGWKSDRVYKTDYGGLDFLVDVGDELDDLHLKNLRIKRELVSIGEDFD